MPFRNDAQLDPSQVQDRRGGGGLGAGVAVGGGGLGLLVLLALALFFGFDPSSVIGNLPQDQPSYAGQPSSTLQQCQSGADANAREDCRVVGFVNSIQAYWKQAMAQRGQSYQPAQTVLFTDATQTGCGTATSEVGPFYCPEDKHVYLDLSFLDELHNRFGASRGPLAEGYVVAHEYGHHIQDLTGVLEQGGGAGTTGPNSRSVAIELQADCYAGVWAKHAVDTGYLTPFSDQDLSDALTTAAAVGDDRIQQRTTGRINPERWTHGSSEQRQQWFSQGYKTGDPAACSTAGR